MSFPNYPGIPPLRNSGQIEAAVSTLGSGVLSSLLNLLIPQWGIYDKDGNEAIVPDNFISIEHDKKSSISNYPIEQGSFASYNKVMMPKSWSIVMTKGGTQQELTDFATTLESLENSIDLYTIVTPNDTWINANLETCSYRRSLENGAGMIVARLQFVEIRQAYAAYTSTGAANPTNTIAPSAQAQQHDGAVSSFSANGLSYTQNILSSVGGYQ